MADRPIPTHEREVIEVVARKQWRGDVEKVPTTAIKVFEVDGVLLSSRYEKAHELEAMRNMVKSADPALRRFIDNIWCDSKAQACYTVTLKDCSEYIGRKVAEQLDLGCRELNGGHNGIHISGNRGADLTRDPWWHWGDEA